MLARTPNSHPTPAHLPDVGGNIPAAAAHSSDDMMKGIENNWETRKLFIVSYRGQELHVLKRGGGDNEGHHQLGKSTLTCLGGGPHVDA